MPRHPGIVEGGVWQMAGGRWQMAGWYFSCSLAEAKTKLEPQNGQLLANTRSTQSQTYLKYRGIKILTDVKTVDMKIRYFLNRPIVMMFY